MCGSEDGAGVWAEEGEMKGRGRPAAGGAVPTWLSAGVPSPGGETWRIERGDWERAARPQTVEECGGDRRVLSRPAPWREPGEAHLKTLLLPRQHLPLSHGTALWHSVQALEVYGLRRPQSAYTQHGYQTRVRGSSQQHHGWG